MIFYSDKGEETQEQTWEQSPEQRSLLEQQGWKVFCNHDRHPTETWTVRGKIGFLLGQCLEQRFAKRAVLPFVRVL